MWTCLFLNRSTFSIQLTLRPQVLKVLGASIELSKWPVIVSAMETMDLTGDAWDGEKENPRSRRRGIIFTRSKGRCEDVFACLDTFFASIADVVMDDEGQAGGGVDVQVIKYHSQMPEAERIASFDAFTSDFQGLIVMVATTAAGVSLDHDRVRWTIHEGGVYGDNNLAQETGRAGRDGKPALAVLLVDDGTQAWMMRQELNARSSEQARILHEHYPVVKGRSIQRARETLDYGVAGGTMIVYAVV